MDFLIDNGFKPMSVAPVAQTAGAQAKTRATPATTNLQLVETGTGKLKPKVASKAKELKETEKDSK